jgi:hypothetical protein
MNPGRHRRRKDPAYALTLAFLLVIAASLLVVATALARAG